MNPYFKCTKNHQVELKGDLLIVRNSVGELITGITVPVVEAVVKFNQMVEKVKLFESKK